MKPTTLTLNVYHPVPSLNKLFAMGHWQRKKEKEATQRAVLSALQVAESGFSTQTTLPPSILSTACDTLASYMTTARQISYTKSLKKKLKRKTKKKQ